MSNFGSCSWILFSVLFITVKFLNLKNKFNKPHFLLSTYQIALMARRSVDLSLYATYSVNFLSDITTPAACVKFLQPLKFKDKWLIF